MVTIPLVCRRRSAVLMLVATLTGCATTAGSSSYARLDADFERSERPHSAAPSRNEDSAVSASVLDEGDYVRAVLQNNPSLESARQGFRAALARVRQSGGFEDPMLDIGVAPLSIGSSRASFGYELGISQKLPWFGKRSLDAAVSAAEAEAARNDYESVKRELGL
ncbi:MAG TPA: TolC family protein, partial [Polyangiaceae bacterium]